MDTKLAFHPLTGEMKNRQRPCKSRQRPRSKVGVISYIRGLFPSPKPPSSTTRSNSFEEGCMYDVTNKFWANYFKFVKDDVLKKLTFAYTIT